MRGTPSPLTKQEHEKYSGSTAGKCRACNRALRVDEIVSRFKLDTQHFKDPMFMIHAACLAVLAATAPPPLRLPSDPLAAREAIRQEVLEAHRQATAA